jgi:predicted lysophospholipase L1 biosynthesis ABC-type transport system permease subunit
MAEVMEESPSAMRTRPADGAASAASEQAIKQIETRRRFWVSTGTGAVAMVLLLIVWATSAGWVVGIPLGRLIDRFLVWLVKQIVNIDVPFNFPLGNLALVLAGTVVITLLVTLMPIRRAVHFRPGDALRYA